MRYSFRSAFVLGFHGCQAATARDIISGKSRHLRASENNYDWLGSGVYFWESSASRAIQWAQEHRQRHSRRVPLGQPAVVGAIIDLGNCLDLLDSQNFGLVCDAHLQLQQKMELAGLPMPENRPLPGRANILLRNLDCSVINLIHEIRNAENLPPFDTVRAAFTEGEPLYKGAGFHDKNHIQICVRNLACIKGYFRPIWDSAEED